MRQQAAKGWDNDWLTGKLPIVLWKSQEAEAQKKFEEFKQEICGCFVEGGNPLKLKH